MNCYLHPDVAATAFCRECGRPLCSLCQRVADGTVYCADHLPATSGAGFSAANPNIGSAPNPYFHPAAPPPPATGANTSPGLAFVLGWIPGVGAIYNSQYVKGLVHVVIFALIVSVLSSDVSGPSDAFLGILLAAFIIYMPFEAYHTAKKRQLGVPVDELSSLVGPHRYGSRFPIGPIVLIAIGVLFLLDTLHLLEFREIGRFWPVLLIALGAYMLYNRVAPGDRKPVRPSVEPRADSTVGSRHD